MITVAITDAQGRVVPVAGNLAGFDISREGKIIGVETVIPVPTSRMFT
jgi:hypothetical protein